MDHLISSVFEDFCGNVTGSQCAKNGGLASLLNAFALHSEQTKFRAGSFGSVWFDMKLGGGSGAQTDGLTCLNTRGESIISTLTVGDRGVRYTFCHRQTA